MRVDDAMQAIKDAIRTLESEGYGITAEELEKVLLAMQVERNGDAAQKLLFGFGM